MPKFYHQTVLLDAVVENLQPSPDGRYLDCTLGGGGHAEAILLQSGGLGQLWGIDRDPFALSASQQRLAKFGDRFHAVHGCFADLEQLVRGPFHGIIMDLGVSSPQLDQAERGFSFQKDGPLDMRMDPTEGIPASEWLQEIDTATLIHTLRKYGDEPRARRIANAVMNGRPWHRTLPLAETIAKSSGYHGSRTHPATRTFQAIRMAINGEMEQLERGMEAALSALAPGGRLAVISFHSIEDRVIKHRLRRAAGIGTPRDAYGHPVDPPMGRLRHPKGIAGRDLDPNNPRARSARLRIFEKSSPPSQP